MLNYVKAKLFLRIGQKATDLHASILNLGQTAGLPYWLSSKTFWVYMSVKEILKRGFFVVD